MRKTGFERLAIAVDVGEERDQHCKGRRLDALRSRSRNASAGAKKSGPDPDQWIRAAEWPSPRTGEYAASAGYCFVVGGVIGAGAPIGRVGEFELLTGRGG